MTDPSPDLPRLLETAADQVSDLLDQRLASACRLSAVQWRVLDTIASNGITSSGEIGAATGWDKVKVSRAVASLVDMGMVKRSPDQHDKRSFLLRTSKRGAAAVARSRSVVPDLEADLAARLTAPEMRALRSALVRLQGCGEQGS